MRKARLAVIALLVMGAAIGLNAQSGTTYTFTWVNSGTAKAYGIWPPCLTLGLNITSINNQPTTGQPFFCPNYDPETGYTMGKAAIDIPLADAPNFSGGDMNMNFGGYEKGTSPAFPGADTFAILTMYTFDTNPWTGSTTQWFKSTTKQVCGRGGCHPVTNYQSVGGTGSMSMVVN